MIWISFKKTTQGAPFFLICTLLFAAVVGVYSAHVPTVAYGTSAVAPAPGIIPPPQQALPIPPQQRLSVAPNVNTQNIFDKAITTPKLADGAVTNSKIAPDILNFQYRSFATADRQNTLVGPMKVRLLIPDPNPAPQNLLVFVPVGILDANAKCPTSGPVIRGFIASQSLNTGDSGEILGRHAFTVNCQRQGYSVGVFVIERANDNNGDKQIILESSLAYEGWTSPPDRPTRVTEHKIITMGWPVPAVIPGPE